MADITDCFRLASDPNYFYEFIVGSAIRQAQLGEAIEDYVHKLHGVPNRGASQACYARELREEAERLCTKYGADLIIPHFKKQLGEQKFSLYFGNN